MIRTTVFVARCLADAAWQDWAALAVTVAMIAALGLLCVGFGPDLVRS